MNIVNKAGPAVPFIDKTQAKASELRERAVKAFMGASEAPQSAPQAAQEAPVLNATQVSPEELGALKTASQAENRQPYNNSEAPVSTEAPAAPEATKTEEEPRLSQQYAILARKEKALRAKVQAQEQAYKAKEDALRAREEALKAKESEYQSNYIPKDRITKDPFSTLSELGITYDQITEQALNRPQDPALLAYIQRLEAKLDNQAKSTQDRLEAQAKADQERQTQQYQQAVKQIRNDVVSMVKSDPSSYEMIEATRSHDDVVELITKTFEKDGDLLSVEEAAAEVEAYLVEQAERLARTKKIQQRLTPKQVAAMQSQAAAEGKPANQAQTQAKTLTNSVGSAPKLSARDRAILAMQGKLNK